MACGAFCMTCTNVTGGACFAAGADVLLMCSMYNCIYTHLNIHKFRARRALSPYDVIAHDFQVQQENRERELGYSYKSASPACSSLVLFTHWVGSDHGARIANSAAPFAAANVGSDRKNSGFSSYIAEMEEFTTSRNLGFS